MFWLNFDPFFSKKQSVMTDTFFEKNPLKSYVFKGYYRIRLNQFK